MWTMWTDGHSWALPTASPFYANCGGAVSSAVNETYDAETETRRSKQRLETFGRDVQAVSRLISYVCSAQHLEGPVSVY